MEKWLRGRGQKTKLSSKASITGNPTPNFNPYISSHKIARTCWESTNGCLFLFSLWTPNTDQPLTPHLSYASFTHTPTHVAFRSLLGNRVLFADTWSHQMLAWKCKQTSEKGNTHAKSQASSSSFLIVLGSNCSQLHCTIPVTPNNTKARSETNT